MPTSKRTIEYLYSNQHEQSLLSAIMLLSARQNLFELDTIFNKVKPTDICNIPNRIIFTAMFSLYKDGKPTNFATVYEHLRKNGNDDKCGGVQYLTKIVDLLPSAVYYDQYIETILDYSKRRQLEKIGLFLGESVYTKQSTDSIFAETEKLLNAIGIENENDSLQHIGIAVDKEMQRIENVQAGKYDEFGLSTGFPTLDRQLWGLQKSDLVIVGARAGTGKTAFALNILDHCANTKKKKCLFFCLEMPDSQIVKRLLSLHAEIDSYEIKKVQGLDPKSLQKIATASQSLKNSNLYVNYKSNISVREIQLLSKQFKRKNGLDLVVVDYLQFVKPSQPTKNRFLDVGEIARELKIMARELDVPVIALCQLNRALDYKTNKDEIREPVLADLRESGEIENNADVVIFLHPKDNEVKEVKPMELTIAKFRNGQLAKIKMEYHGNYLKFKELEPPPQKVNKQTKLSDLIEIENGEDDDMPF